MQKAAVPIIAVEDEEEMSRGRNPLYVLIVFEDEEMMSTKSSVSALLLLFALYDLI